MRLVKVLILEVIMRIGGMREVERTRGVGKVLDAVV